MKLCIISHSSINYRQTAFYRTLSKYCKLFIPVPKKWGNQKGYDLHLKNYTQKTYNVINAGDQFRYKYPDELLKDLSLFEPDLIYVQNEPCTTQALSSRYYANQLGSKLVIFTWDNINRFEYQYECDAVICGNKECYDLTDHHNKFILPQVGVDVDLFRPMNIDKTSDIIYVGRMSKEKGIEFLNKFDNINIVSGVSFLDMPAEYNKSKVLVVPSITTELWKEQMPYNIAEALSCELHVVAFDSGSIKSNYGDVITIVPEGDIEQMIYEAKKLSKKGPNEAGREWVVNNLSNNVIAFKVYNIFKNLI